MSESGSVQLQIRPTVARIDLGAIAHNCGVLRGHIGPGVLHLAVVKANAYGHGDVQVARACLQAGVDRLGVALVEEGVALRRHGIDAPVLVLSQPPPEASATVVDNRLTATVWSADAAEAIGAAAAASGETATVHLAVDTGMHREGVEVDEAAGLLRHLSGVRGLRVEGLWTHLATADDPDHPAAAVQLDAFDELLARLHAGDLRPPIVHAANSPATMLLPRSHYDMVRTGIAVYGLAPAASLRIGSGLRPAMRLSSRVAAVRRVAAGEGVGYGHTWSARRDTHVAVVPIGYADGFARVLSNRGAVLIGGERCPVAGRVSMDQIVVECPSGVRPGDEVVLIGCQGDDEITAEEIADCIGTINYEVVSSVGPRVPRDYTS